MAQFIEVVMAIRWMLDGYLGVARRTIELGISREKVQDIEFIVKTFEKIVNAPIKVQANPKSTADLDAIARYERCGDDHFVYITEAVRTYEFKSYLILSECMACCVECGIPAPDDAFAIVEQVFFEERNAEYTTEEYPQVQAERETDLGALEILFPTEEREKFYGPLCSGEITLEDLSKQYFVPVSVLERGMQESYLKYCRDHHLTKAE